MSYAIDLRRREHVNRRAMLVELGADLAAFEVAVPSRVLDADPTVLLSIPGTDVMVEAALVSVTSQQTRIDVTSFNSAEQQWVAGLRTSYVQVTFPSLPDVRLGQILQLTDLLPENDLAWSVAVVVDRMYVNVMTERTEASLRAVDAPVMLRRPGLPVVVSSRGVALPEPEQDEEERRRRGIALGGLK